MSSSKPKYPNLPKHLCHNTKEGFFLDWRSKDQGRERRKKRVLGHITLAHAKEVHAEFYKQLVNGSLGLDAKRKLSLAEAAKSFLEYSKDNKRSFIDDEWRVKELLQYFGDLSLEAVNIDAVEGYKRARRQGFFDKHGRQIAVGTLNREIACLKGIVSRAFKNGYLPRNPLAGLTLPKENNARNVTLEPGQHEVLLSACSPHLKSIVVLAYWTGMRRGEILGLKWSQLDLAKRTIALVAEDTKTNEPRIVPLSQAVIDALVVLPRFEGVEEVFTYQGKPIESIKTAFGKACARAGIAGFKFHDLRHCAVTLMRKAGVADSVIMAISGHKTASMFRRYDRVDLDDKQQAVGKVGDFLETQRLQAVEAA